MPDEQTPNVGSDLLRIHRAITRALQVCMQNSQEAGPVESQQPGFSLYVRALTILLHAHHDGEEELGFPFWQARLPEGPFDTLRAHHRQITHALARVERWLEANPVSWQERAVRKLHLELGSLQTLWIKHIALEEAAIGPENASRVLTLQDNAQLTRLLAEHGQAHSQPSELVMPFIVYNLSGADRVEFAKTLPHVVTQQLIPFAWKETWAPMLPFLLAD
jgi:hypothetical protein